MITDKEIFDFNKMMTQIVNTIAVRFENIKSSYIDKP